MSPSLGQSERSEPSRLQLDLERVALQSAADAQAADAWTIQQAGIPGLSLMELAGHAIAREASALSKGAPVAILCGPGNNGGDGWIAARHLLGSGHDVIVIATRAPDALTGDAAAAAQMYLRIAEHLKRPAPAFSLATEARPAKLPADAGVIVDALFGTGISRPLHGVAAALVSQCNAHPAPVIAVDLPSGLPTDGAAPDGEVILATRSVTFGARKIAHASEPGRFYCGEVSVVDIGLHTDPSRPPSQVFAVQKAKVSPPDAAAHKGTFGHLGVLAGAGGTQGAARLSAYAARRGGAGLVSLLVPEGAAPSDRPDVMTRSLLSAHALSGLSAVVVGPGMGRDAEAQERGQTLLQDAATLGLPAVIDADALPLITQLNGALVATPHPREAARLLECEVSEIQRDRIEAARALTALHTSAEVTWVLKGAVPIVAAPTGALHLLGGGAPALAVAGSGDILAGLIGALLARGYAPSDAALAGTLAHQNAGAALTRGALPSEIADAARRELV